MFTLNILQAFKNAYRKVIIVSSILILLLGQTGAEKEIIVPSVGDEICISGYIMDTYCIDLGVLLDAQQFSTLSPEGPPNHSVHCLIDVSWCNESPYEVLNELDNGHYGRSWRLASNDLIIEYAYEHGGCDDCKNPAKTDGVISKGLRLTLNATVVDLGNSNTPPTINVVDAGDIHSFEDFASVCGENAPIFTPPNGMVTTGGSLVRPILIHGSLMLIAWGLLLPTGVMVAAFGKHRSDAWWFKVHRIIQPLGLLFAIIAWIIALRHFSVLGKKPDGASLNYPHAVLGMTTMVIGLIQPINAIFRPHPPKEGEDKALLRFVWELLHKGLGWIGILLGLITVGMGTTLILDNAQKITFQVCYALSIGVIASIALFLYCEKRKFRYEEPKKNEDVEHNEEDVILGADMPLRSKGGKQEQQ